MARIVVFSLRYPLECFAMHRMFSVGIVTTIVLCLLAFNGCGGTAPSTAPAAAKHDDHDHAHDRHDDHVETYAAAVKELQEFRDQIRDAFAAKKVDQADELLHEVGHVIEELPKLAEKEHFPTTDILAIQSLSKALFDHFAQIDKKVHGGEGATYAELAGKIDAAIQELVQRMAKKPQH